jgi:hypothetical protein
MESPKSRPKQFSEEAEEMIPEEESAEQPMYHQAEHVILEKLHKCTSGNAKCTPDDAELMHKDFEGCESYQLYESYERNEIPTFERMEEGIAQLIANIPEDLKNDPEAQRITQLIKGRALALRGSVRSYVATVIQFVTYGNSLAAKRDPDGVPQKMVEIDHKRRRQHDSLLTSLSETLKLLQEAYDYGICEKEAYREWSPGDTTTTPRGVLPVFSAKAIANRDLIKNWALAADFEEHYRKLTELLNIKE